MYFKPPAKRERAVTRRNPTAQMRPILDSYSYVPVRTLHRRNCPHSASSVLAFRVSCHIIAVFVFRKPLFISLTLPYLCMLHEYHVIQYYPQFYTTAVVLRTYYRGYRDTPAVADIRQGVVLQLQGLARC
jgi:hypothetical protein